MPSTFVPVATVTSRTEAELIAGLLRNYDVRAVVSADDAGGQEPALQNQGVRVLVASCDEAAARQLLAAAWDTPQGQAAWDTPQGQLEQQARAPARAFTGAAGTAEARS
jgi:hypothetical protein